MKTIKTIHRLYEYNVHGPYRTYSPALRGRKTLLNIVILNNLRPSEIYEIETINIGTWDTSTPEDGRSSRIKLKGKKKGKSTKI